jgi:CheY-like chemotaxis protein
VNRILLVEDDHSVRQALAELLSFEGYVVTCARDGIAALDSALRSPPDLIITDLQMPRMRGDGLIERLRDEGIDVPVVVITASTLPAPARAAHVLRKPFDIDRLMEILERTLIQPKVGSHDGNTLP